MRAALGIFTIGISFLSIWTTQQMKEERVAFVGCPADGQVGPLDPPNGTARTVALSEVQADQIAYYRGEFAPGLFAPAGWNCRIWYGSSGSTLVVTPATIDAPNFSPGYQYPKFRDQTVEMNYSDAGTSELREGLKLPGMPHGYFQP
jgi:hypothetical protein